jgi:pyrroloquinoline quinone biosynthesis protein E
VWKCEGEYDGENELSTKDAIALITKAVRESRCRHFTFTGGEPCLRDDLEVLVAAARNAGRARGGRLQDVALITNGTLLTAGRVRELIHAGVDLFELPLNSSDRRRHDAMAGVDGCFDAVVGAAAAIDAVGAALAFVFVGTRRNMEDWPEVLRLGVALGAQSFLFNRYNAGGTFHSRAEQLRPTVEQVREGLAEANRFAERYGVGISASIAIPPCLIDHADYQKVGFGFCAAGTARAYYTLDPLGNVRPCNHTSTKLGNLFDAPLMRIIADSPKLIDFRNARPEFCSGCRLERECQGGCKAAAEACSGSLHACDPFLAANLDNARRLPRQATPIFKGAKL